MFLFFLYTVPPQPPNHIFSGRSDGISGNNGFGFIEIDWVPPNETDIDFYDLKIFEHNNYSVPVDVLRVVDEVTREVVVFSHNKVAQNIMYRVNIYTVNKCNQTSAESANITVSIKLRLSNDTGKYLSSCTMPSHIYLFMYGTSTCHYLNLKSEL